MKKNLNKFLAGNDYPGRGIVLGQSPDGEKADVAYWIMGRSSNSRNRIFTEDGGTVYTRKVINRAFLDYKKTQNVDKTGSSEVNSFLLVLPGPVVQVAVGDKVMAGEGPEITGREDWAALIPSKVPGLVVVKYVDPKYYHGTIVHTEAGG